MRFTALSAIFLLSSTALGARFTEKRRASRQARQAVHASQPKLSVETPSDVNVSNVEYSSNWAGAVLISTGFTEVTGTVTVPSVSEGSSGSSSYSAGSAWVGIDGDTCGTAILQTGIDWYVEGDTVEYDAWYEWYPDYAYDFSGITISEGDEILMTVVATSETSGSATIENLTTGETVSETFTDVDDGSLCEYNAEWIVEDFSECTGNSCSLVSFADFGSVTFTDASAVKSGSTVDTDGATIIDIYQDTVLTECSASGSTVTCEYTG